MSGFSTRSQLGILTVDAGDVVCFSMDAVIRMANGPDDVDAFIARHRGVRCEFEGDGIYGVDALTVSDSAGETFHIVCIGLPNDSIGSLDPTKPITVMCLVEGGNFQFARASVPVAFGVVDLDNKQASDPEEQTRIAELEKEYESLPHPIY